MRTGNAAFITGLSNAKTDGLAPRRFLYLKAKTRTDPVEDYNIGFWTGDDDVTVNVVDGETGLVVSRTYYGMGKSLFIPKIPRTSDLSIQMVQVTMSQLAIEAQTLVRENNVRFAKADIHEGLLSTETRLLVSAPEIAFLGEVDGDPVDTPEVGGVGQIGIELVSDAIRSLTRTNPKKRSYETQLERSGDLFGSYSNLVENIEVVWGEAK